MTSPAIIPKGLAEFFKEAFEKIHGKGSVVAFETFTTKDRDFSAQLTKIVASKADILFTPQYYDEVPLIVKQAHELGWKKPILGSDSWDSAELMTLCGNDCKGSFFSTHYAALGAKGATKEFIDSYKKKYGYEPDAVAALTWDSIGLLLHAIQNTKGLTGDLKKDRKAIRDSAGEGQEIRRDHGHDGLRREDRRPNKCAVMVKISPEGKVRVLQIGLPVNRSVVCLERLETRRQGRNPSAPLPLFCIRIGRGDPLTLSIFLQNVLNALQWGSFYALIALGYNMVYGVLLLINFAHGDVFMVGAYVGFFISTFLLGTYAIQLPWALPPGVVTLSDLSPDDGHYGGRGGDDRTGGLPPPAAQRGQPSLCGDHRPDGGADS